MAKKSKKGGSVSLDLIFKVGVALFAVAAVAMLFLVTVSFVTKDGDLIKEFTGFQQMFGLSVTSTDFVTITTHYLGFNFVALLPAIFVIAGAVCAFVDNKIVNFVGAGLLVVAAVMFFLMPNFVSIIDVDTLTQISTADKLASATATAVLENGVRNLGIGAILGGVFSVVAGALSVVRIVKK